MLENLITELKLRGFSKETIKSYFYHNVKFLHFIKKTENEISETDVKNYIAYLMHEKNSSVRTIALVKAALKFYFDEILKKNVVTLKTPKAPKKLPTVLSKQEIKNLIKAANYLKTKLIIKFLYSTGIRVSELCNFKVNELELSEGIGWVRSGKGAKDRLILLSECLRTEIEEYLKENKSIYLFPGHNGPISPRNIQEIIARTARKAGIMKHVTPHTMRHSFATHMLENGTDIRKIQELLGHSNLQTTQIYTQVSTSELKKLRSPLDDL